MDKTYKDYPIRWTIGQTREENRVRVTSMPALSKLLRENGMATITILYSKPRFHARLEFFDHDEQLWHTASADSSNPKTAVQRLAIQAMLKGYTK